MLASGSDATPGTEACGPFLSSWTSNSAGGVCVRLFQSMFYEPLYVIGDGSYSPPSAAQKRGKNLAARLRAQWVTQYRVLAK
jgi:hypothetical protein